jgi:hypothetical protein
MTESRATTEYLAKAVSFPDIAAAICDVFNI